LQAESKPFDSESLESKNSSNAPEDLSNIAVRLQNVTKKYEMGDYVRYALKEVDLDIYKGEFIVILGPSGSGKTTMLNLIGAVDQPSDGKIWVNGIPLHQSEDGKKVDLTSFRRFNISYVFQFFNLIPALTARENVEFALQLVRRGRKRKELEKEALQHLDAVGLKDHANQFPAECSGGEQQRIAIARALAKGTPLVLGDEPTGELDFETGRQVLKVLKRIPEEGRAMVLVTHNSEIAKIADRIVYLRGGEIARIVDNQEQQAPVDDLVW